MLAQILGVEKNILSEHEHKELRYFTICVREKPELLLLLTGRYTYHTILGILQGSVEIGI